MMSDEELLRAVQQTLAREWDPIGVSGNELCHGEYDSYAPTICRYLREGADEYKLVVHLRRLQLASMGLSRVDEDRNRRVARQLIALLASRRNHDSYN